MRHRSVRIARDREKALDDGERIARQRAALQGRLFQEAIGDFGDRAPADIGGACNRHQVGHERQRRLAVGAGERRKHAFVFATSGSGCERQSLDVLDQADLAVEILDQPPPPDRIEPKRVNQGVEQRDVAGADFNAAQSERGRGFQRQREHLGIGRRAIWPSEGFDAGLQELASSAAAIAEHRPEIAEPRRLTGTAGRQIVPRHRNGEVGT